MNDIEILNKAINQYGVKLQSLMAVEEMAELTQLIIKFQRNTKGYEVSEPKQFVFPDDYDSIIDEIADVEICLTQLKIMFQCFEDVVIRKRFKLDRLKKRLDNED